MTELDPDIAARLKRDAAGLVTAVVQEHGTGTVLMVAWMNDEALALTLATRQGTYFTVPAAPVGQGRDIGTHPVRAFGAVGLRWRHAGPGSGSVRTSLPHRRAQLL